MRDVTTGRMQEALKIAVLGVGAMGGRMAINLGAAGHDVTVWNRTTGVAHELASMHGLTAADTAREAVRGAHIVISMLTDDHASRAVWLDADAGVLGSLEPAAVAIESSTVSVAMATTLADAAAAHGVDMLVAPVLGSRPQAELGQLFYLVGGSMEVADRVRDVLDVNGGTVRHVGTHADAALMKLAVNGLLAIQVAAYAEMVGLVERSAMDTDRALDVFAHLPLTSAPMQHMLGRFARCEFEPNFPIDLVAKDMDYLARARESLSATGPLGDAVAQLYSESADSEIADLDIAAVSRRYRSQAHLEACAAVRA